MSSGEGAGATWFQRFGTLALMVGIVFS